MPKQNEPKTLPGKTPRQPAAPTPEPEPTPPAVVKEPAPAAALIAPRTAPPEWDEVERELRLAFAGPVRTRERALRLALERLQRLWPAKPAADEPAPATEHAPDEANAEGTR